MNCPEGTRLVGYPSYLETLVVVGIIREYMWVKGSQTGWISMTHNWGASYQAFATLGGQPLSFRITSYTTKETIISWNVAPADWQVGLTYGADANFH